MTAGVDERERRWTCEDCGEKVVGDEAALAHCDDRGHSLALGREELERILGRPALEILPGLPDVAKITPRGVEAARTGPAPKHGVRLLDAMSPLGEDNA